MADTSNPVAEPDDAGEERALGAQDLALSVVQEICAVSGLEMSARLHDRQDAYIHIELLGEQGAQVFGHGRTLDALQYLVNLIVARRTNENARVLLDAGGYREQRAERLRTMALECAAQVKERAEECELDPLPPHERRLVHRALLDDPEVRTYSEGVEPNRCVIIAPR